jgi:hypothetical protein
MMSKAFEYTCKVTLPTYGEVTIEAEYYQGHMGTYWVPPDPDEINVVTVTTSEGQPITLTDEEHEQYYYLMLEAVSEAHSAYLDKQFNQYAEEYLATLDKDIPY